MKPNHLQRFLALVSSLALALGLLGAPAPAGAVDAPPVSTAVGPWVVTNLANEADGWRLEVYKVDRDLVAWTSINEAAAQRRLSVFDGTNVRLLATLAVNEWNDVADAPFFDPVGGNFDAADGLVVWTQSDGSDREIWSYDGNVTRRVSNNTYDDKHPVTSRGRIAWTSVPNPAYNLMVSDRAGIRRLDGWHVLNYAFSGQNLFWLNRRGNEDWFRVWREDGKTVQAVGEGDDRPLRQYFYVDGKGNAAWEYSTQRWEYDKRIVYLAYDGELVARRVIQRDVPPNITRLEDVNGAEVLINSTDLLTSLVEETSLLRVGSRPEQTVVRKIIPIKARFIDGGIVRHREPDGNTALVLWKDDGGSDFITLDPVVTDRFEADGDVVAGAKLGGGIVTWAAGETTVITTTAEARDLDVKNGVVAWIEGNAGHAILKAAMRGVLVKSGTGTKLVGGRLTKSLDSANVYLAANDGKRYLFPAEGLFFGWYPNFRSLRQISRADLAALPLGGNALYKPGSRLVKASSSPRIYAVGENAKLHWIVSMNVLTAIYGPNWTQKLDVVPETVLADYAYGSTIADPFRYQMALME